MSRRDALLRLHQSLVARRDGLRKRLGFELNDLRNQASSDSTGDSADQAFESGSEEVASQLAEIESRELSQIERALTQLKRGSYGLCEHCQRRIPVARLNALPFSTTCVPCQEEMDVHGGWSRGRSSNWDKVRELDTQEDQREVSISDIEVDYSQNR